MLSTITHFNPDSKRRRKITDPAPIPIRIIANLPLTALLGRGTNIKKQRALDAICRCCSYFGCLFVQTSVITLLHGHELREDEVGEGSRKPTAGAAGTTLVVVAFGTSERQLHPSETCAAANAASAARISMRLSRSSEKCPSSCSPRRARLNSSAAGQRSVVMVTVSVEVVEVLGSELALGHGHDYKIFVL